MIKRGDIFYADLNPVIGSEQGGRRPVLIVQNNKGNAFSPTVIIAAITSTIKKPKLPTHILLPEKEGLNEESIVLLEQIRTIDKKRLKNKIGSIDNEIMHKIDKAIFISLGISKESLL